MNTSVDININQRFELANTENYYSSIETSRSIILSKYILLLMDYIRLILDKSKNKTYFKFVIIRGLNTMTNVFNTILYFTKNVELAFSYSQKSFYLYIEFVKQISHDENTFLQLNTKDAIMYVYKKTIHELNHSFIKNMESNSVEDNKLNVVKEYITIYENIFIHFLNKYDFVDLRDNPHLIIMENIFNNINNNELTKEKLFQLNLCINKLNTIKKIDTYLECVLQIVTHATKINQYDFSEKFLSGMFDSYAQNENTSLFIEWLKS